MQAFTADMATDAKVTEAPLQRSVTGYGPKLPTPYMFRIANRWHRVYVANYGNAGSAYVVLHGEKHWLAPSAELVLETVRDGGTFADAIAKLQSWPDGMKNESGK